MSFKINDDRTVSVVCDVCGGLLNVSDGAVFKDRATATDALWAAGWEDYEIRPSWDRPDDPVIVNHECGHCIEDDRDHELGC